MRRFRMNGRAACLDIGPSSPLVEELLMDCLQDVFTVLENDLGTPLCDVYYINELHERKPEHRIFVVPR